MTKNKPTFKDSLKENKPCPKCGGHIIHLHGGGWDYDREYCYSCDYEVEYDTSSDDDEEVEV